MLCPRKLAFVALLLTTSLFSANFLPLRQGNTWTYRESKTGRTFTVEVRTPVVMNDRTYYSLNGYVEQQLFVRIDESGQLVYVDEESGREAVLTPFIPLEQGWWEAPFRQCDQLSQALEKRGMHDGAAGPFENVLEVRYRSVSCADAGVEAEQFAENIGMVRRVVTSLAGPQTFDLIYARVGNLLIDAATSGSFSVSADLTPELTQIPVTLRLYTNPGAELKLSFATSQEYELQLLDPAGRIVWRWSDGRVFSQAEHELKVHGQWSEQVLLPRSALLEGASLAAPFTLQAWLTTSGATPRFAVSLPVVVVAPAIALLRPSRGR